MDMELSLILVKKTQIVSSPSILVIVLVFTIMVFMYIKLSQGDVEKFTSKDPIMRSMRDLLKLTESSFS